MKKMDKVLCRICRLLSISFSLLAALFVFACVFVSIASRYVDEPVQFLGRINGFVLCAAACCSAAIAFHFCGRDLKG